MIEVSHLTKRYAAHTAVEDLSFTVPDVGVYGLLGPNGAGKTTTMNIMTGCLAATSGTVSIGGYDIFEDEYEAKRRLGCLPELPPLYLDSTPREYLDFVARAKGLAGEELRRDITRVLHETNTLDVADRLMRNLSFVFLVIVPILTMRTFAAEKRAHTDNLLYSLPVSMTKVVMGKYFALLTVFVLPVLVICLYPLVLSFFGEVYLPAAYGSIVAFLFLGAALLAAGMFISSLTESQAVAAGVCFAVLLVNFFLADLAENLAAFSLFERYYDFMDGVFDLGTIVFYATVAGVFCFLTVQSMEKRRWA